MRFFYNLFKAFIGVFLLAFIAGNKPKSIARSIQTKQAIIHDNGVIIIKLISLLLNALSRTSSYLFLIIIFPINIITIEISIPKIPEKKPITALSDTNTDKISLFVAPKERKIPISLLRSIIDINNTISNINPAVTTEITKIRLMINWAIPTNISANTIGSSKFSASSTHLATLDNSFFTENKLSLPLSVKYTSKISSLKL